VNRHERGGACGLHADRRSFQPKLVRHARRQIVVLVSVHRVRTQEDVRRHAALKEMQQVRARGGARVHANWTTLARRIARRIFERLPCALEKHPLLRIGQLRFLPGEPEELGVEQIDVVEDAARANVLRILKRA